MDEKLFKDTFSRLHVSRTAKEQVISRAGEKRQFSKKPLIITALAAALLCALTVTALAGGGFFGKWRESALQWGETPLINNGLDCGFLVPDDTPEDNTDNLVQLPELYLDERVWVNDEGRVMLRLYVFQGTSTIVYHELDITDDLAASPDGTYSFYDKGTKGDVNWEFDVTVKPGKLTGNKLVGEGDGYLISWIRTAAYHASEGRDFSIRVDEDAWKCGYGCWNGGENVPQDWERDLGQ